VTSGAHTVAVSDGVLSDHVNVTADADTTARLDIPGLPGSATAGTDLPTPVVSRDRFGNQTPGYRGTVTFVITDARATAPANFTYSPADAGSHVVHVAFATVGSQLILAHDAGNAAISGEATVEIDPAAADHCSILSAPAAARAGTPLPMQVKFLDSFAN